MLSELELSAFATAPLRRHHSAPHGLAPLNNFIGQKSPQSWPREGRGEPVFCTAGSMMVRLQIATTANIECAGEGQVKVYSNCFFFQGAILDTSHLCLRRRTWRGLQLLCVDSLAERPNCPRSPPHHWLDHPLIVNHLIQISDPRIAITLPNQRQSKGCQLYTEIIASFSARKLFRAFVQLRTTRTSTLLERAADISPALSMDPAEHHDQPSMQATDPAKKKNIVIVGSSFWPCLLFPDTSHISHPTRYFMVPRFQHLFVCLSTRDFRGTGLARTYLILLA